MITLRSGGPLIPSSPPQPSSFSIDVSFLVPGIYHYRLGIFFIILQVVAKTEYKNTTTKIQNLSKLYYLSTSSLPSSTFAVLHISLLNKDYLTRIRIGPNNKIIMEISTSSIMAIAAAAIATTTRATRATLRELKYNFEQHHDRNASSDTPEGSLLVAAAVTITTTATTTATLSAAKGILHPDNSSALVEATAFTLSTSSSSSSSPSQSPSAYSTVFCPTSRHNVTLPKTELYCNWTWDKFLCWPPTDAGKVAHLPCPPGHGIDVTKFAERRCGWDGRWEGRPGATQDLNANGWTNYTPCYTPEILELMKKVYAGGNGEVVRIKFDIIERTRTLEIVGLMLSLFALLLSLMIFCNFRSLRNNRTKIHKNLFIAMVIQVLIRLTLYLDQAIIRRGHEIAGNGSKNGIENTPYLCEASYIFLEYAGTAMFMWMFIEGLYLHNVITVTVFQGRFPHTLYLTIGWGGPVVMTAIWAFVTAHYKGQDKCWWNYNLTPYYWILEGPRLTVIFFNFFFLLNIIRVLVVKLRQSHTSDVEQVRKAVRAAVVLLPLLGITNLLHMTEAPLDKTAWEFALWSYITNFLRSFQGLFIAMIYCFLNGEVRAALLKSISVYMSIHGHANWAPRRASMFSAAYNTAPDTDGHESIHRRESSTTRTQNSSYNRRNRTWMISLCFRGQKVLREPPVSSPPPETNV